MTTAGMPGTRQVPGPEARARRAARCRRKFLRYFPAGFRDETYLDWERGYKWAAHERWEASLGQAEHLALLRAGAYAEVAQRAVTIESRTNLLFSFEKMALRDAVRPREGAEGFATGLYEWLYGRASEERKLERWIAVAEALPRRQTRVLTWPLVTVFGFLALPERHLFLKPTVTRRAAEAYGFPLHYASRPSWAGYASLLEFAATVRRDLRDLRPRDMIDLQSFIWVQGSDEYPA
ncbi:MAG TPA: hypothetical protein VFS40_14900 [Gemmatimonadales bacterium]|nr:hypothetical protein [Gemmatimonadales bacterium]